MLFQEILKSLEKNDPTYFSNCSVNTKYYGSGTFNVNSQCNNGSTYFTWAVRKSNLQTITHLLAKGADIDKRELGGATPLLLAIYLNRLEIVQCLVRRGADVKLRDSYETPLTAAVQVGNLEMVEFLIDNGADPNDCDIRGTPPLIKAIKENKLAIVDLFFKKQIGDVVVDSERNTPLVAAIRNNSSLDVIRCLLGHNVIVNFTKNEKTPLAWASLTGNVEVLQLLLSNKADINLVDRDGNTPLATAVQYKQSEAAKFLTNNKANVCKEGEKGKSPLFWAVLNQDFEMITWLLDHGAEYIVHKVFSIGIETKNLEIVKLLKERGGFDLKNYDNGDEFPPLAVAIDSECVEIAKYLIENGQNVIYDLPQVDNLKVIEFLQSGNIDMVKLLTENGARLNEYTYFGDTVFTTAVEMENFDMVKYFVDQGADVNKANEKGLTPLVLAKSSNNFQIFQYLVGCGAEISKEDENANPTLARYYRMAQESIAKRRKVCYGMETIFS